MVYPPFVEGPIRSNEETLLRGGCFGKSVRDICAIYQEILCGRHGIEETRTGLIDTIGIPFVEYTNHTQASGPIANASSLLAPVDGFNCVRPNEVEDCVFF